MPGSFFDSTVVLSLASGETAKADRTERLIDRGGTVSVQVLNEVASVARRKMRLSWAETRAFLSMIRGLVTVVPLTVEIHDTGLDLAERYGLSMFDAMIAASALLAGCDTLWSEDMQHDLAIERRLRVANPFRRSR
jgi:predicted nucleic acid-binding protein